MKNELFKSLVTALACAYLCACSDKFDVSGTYVEKYTNGVSMLQVVQTPDGHITGQFTEVLLIDGRIEDGNASVTGVVNGKQISLQLRPVAFLPVATEFSGVVDIRGLSLNGAAKEGRLSTMRLVRGSLAEFQAGASKTRDDAEAIKMADAQVEARKRAVASVHASAESIDNLVSRLNVFIQKQNAVKGAFPKYKARFTETTRKMQALLEWERDLRDVPNAGYARGEIVFYLNQQSFNVEQAHSSDLTGEAHFSESQRILSNELDQAGRTCLGLSTAVQNDPYVLLRNACHSLDGAAAPYLSVVKETTGSIARLENTYNVETQKQRQIIAEGKAIE